METPAPMSVNRLFWVACRMGLEGIVSKRRAAAPIAPGDARTGSRSRTRWGWGVVIHRDRGFDEFEARAFMIAVYRFGRCLARLFRSVSGIWAGLLWAWASLNGTRVFV
jgi:hypothetical protein